MTEPTILDVLENAAVAEEAAAPVEGEAAAPAVEGSKQADVAEALAGLEQKVSGPTDEELRAEKKSYLQEKREKLRADREARKQKTNYDELLKTATTTKDTYSKELNEWTESFKDPKALVKAFEKKGVDPYTLWHNLSEGILGEQTPEAQKLRENEKLQQETLSKINPEVEALKKALADAQEEIRQSREFREQYRKEREAYEQYQQQQREAQSKKEFLDYMDEDDEAAEVILSYGPEYTYNFASQLSQAFEKEGKDRSFAALRNAMVAAHKQHVLSLKNSREERAKRRQIVPPSQSSVQKTPAKSVTKTISNRVVTEASKPHPDPLEDEDKRGESVREDLQSLFRLG